MKNKYKTIILRLRGGGGGARANAAGHGAVLAVCADIVVAATACCFRAAP